MIISKMHCFLTNSPKFFSFVFQVPISVRYGINVCKTQTLEALGPLELGELAKPTGAVGSANLADVGVESAKPTP